MNENEKMIEQVGTVASEVGKEIVKQGYQDIGPTLIKPAAATAGLLPRTIRAVLSGLEKWVLQKEYSVAEIDKLLEIKLQKVGAENVVPPEAHIAVPALQYISYCMDNEELRDMYANLLASSMNKVVKNEVHPSYVEIIKQLCPDEAKILKKILEIHNWPLIHIKYFFPDKKGYFYQVRNFSDVGYLANCEYPHWITRYISNLERLGLIEIVTSASIVDKTKYLPLEKHEAIASLIQPQEYKSRGFESFDFERNYFEMTPFGRAFCKICINKDDNKQKNA
jgi:hypothetical protein